MSARAARLRAVGARLLLAAVMLAAFAAPQLQAAGSDAAAELAQLGERLAALDANPALADKGELERWKARQSLSALAVAKSRDRAHLLYVAHARVSAAELAAQADAVRQQSLQLDRERDEIMLEASRRQAEAAQREADRLRRQALAREEEALRFADTAAQERAVLEQENADAGATAEQAMKLAEARAEETRLARKEAELAAAIAGDGGGAATSAATATALPPARTVGKRTLYTLPGTAFASGSATLAPSAVASLRALFKAIGAKKKLRVEAHTDDHGTEASNLALSQRRADAVRKALIATGIAAARVSAVGKGEAIPVADNASAEGRARNRRVEISVE